MQLSSLRDVLLSRYGQGYLPLKRNIYLLPALDKLRMAGIIVGDEYPGVPLRLRSFQLDAAADMTITERGVGRLLAVSADSLQHHSLQYWNETQLQPAKVLPTFSFVLTFLAPLRYHNQDGHLTTSDVDASINAMADILWLVLAQLKLLDCGHDHPSRNLLLLMSL
jgi:hypothetical protein